MLNSGALTAILIALGLLAASLSFPENRRPNLLTFATGVFVLYILPKLGLLIVNETAVLLPSAAALNPQAINAATLLIAGFMSALALAYVLVAVFGRQAEPVPPRRTRYDPAALKTVSIFVVLPSFVVLFALYAAHAGVTADALFAKRDLVVEGSITPAYVLQKAAQVVKCGFYLMLLKMLVDGREPARDVRWVSVFLLCTSAVYLVAGQRSGILILGLEALLAMQLAGALRWKFVLMLSGLFVVANVVVLAARMEEVNLALVNMLLRRYFMDVEKITGILEYAVSDPSWRFNPLTVFLTVSDAEIPDFNIHFVIGERVFGTAGGVPPSALGEIILYFGPIFLLPLTILGGVLVANAERLCLRLREPALQLALVSVLSKIYYFGLNSDSSSLANRSIFDLGLLLLAVFLYKSYKALGRKPLSGPRAAPRTDEPTSTSGTGLWATSRRPSM